MKTTFRIGIAGALVGLSVAVPWALQHHAWLELRARRETLEQQADRLSLLVQDNGRLSNLIARTQSPAPLTGEQLRELLRLRNEKRLLAERTNSVAGLLEDPRQLSPAEIHRAMAAEMIAAMKRLLPALQPALQQYAANHPNQPPPDSLSQLEDYFPLVDGRKMAGLSTFTFARDDAPRLGDALVLVGDLPKDDVHVRIYGFSDGRVVEVTSEDGNFGDWEAQHMTSPLAGTEEKVFLEAHDTARERAHLTEVAATVGISAEDASRFFDQFRQQEKALNVKLAAMEKDLTGSEEEKQSQIKAAFEKELTKLATDTLGDKGLALARKMAAGM